MKGRTFIQKFERFCAAAVAVVSCASFAAAPATYLEYMESDGTQYIDLGIVGRCNLEVEAEVAYVEIPSDGCFIGSRTGNTRVYALHHFNGSMLIGYGDNEYANVYGMKEVKYAIDSRFVKGSQTLSINGQIRATRTVNSEYNTGYNLYLFALNYGGSPQYYTKGRIYSLKIWDLVDGERDSLLGDFRPCLDGDGVPCLYDSVTDDYFHNAGSGTFAYGALPPANAPTVDHYVEYLESDETQYVDTGILGQTGLGTSIKFSFTEVPTDASVLCAFNGGNRLYAVHYTSSSGLYHSYRSANVPSPVQYATAGTVYTVETDLFRDCRNFYINGAEIGPKYTSSNALTDSYPTLHLFGRNYNGVSDYRSKMRLYACSIWGSVYNRDKAETPTLLLDLHPCVDTDGVAGLYDAVSGRILYKGAGNAFVTGPALSSAARVIASNGSEFEGTASPDYGMDDTVAQGDVTTYSCARFFTNEVGTLFECVGYTTATSEDGSLWSAESALVESRSATLEYPGGWWRLTWNWRRAGYHITAQGRKGPPSPSPRRKPTIPKATMLTTRPPSSRPARRTGTATHSPAGSATSRPESSTRAAPFRSSRTPTSRSRPSTITPGR